MLVSYITFASLLLVLLVILFACALVWVVVGWVFAIGVYALAYVTVYVSSLVASLLSRSGGTHVKRRE
jgi:hypothetical protein